MTKKDIIETAFRVWGRDFYRKPSLSLLAKELKVSKPALYRHFISKDALYKAMMDHFYNDFAASIKPGFEKAAQIHDSDEGFYEILQVIGNYYARNCYSLIFSLMNAYERKLDREIAHEQIKARGVNTDIIRQIFEKKYDYQPMLLQLIFATLTFKIGNFHRNNDSMINTPTEKQINEVITLIHKTINQGLGFSLAEINSMDFEKLEKLDESKIKSEPQEPAHPMDTFLKAVAEAVAEAGPWETSMELVAKKMGLSKSSLYGHFKNKKDMMRRLFLTEFKRIIDFAKQGTGLSSNTAEQLYLGIYSIAVYLNSKPEILIAIDWLRTRRLDLGKPHAKSMEKDTEISMLFNDINIDSLREYNNEDKTTLTRWIFFLLISVLLKSENKNTQNKTYTLNKEHIRVLYRFITLGLGGFVK